MKRANSCNPVTPPSVMSHKDYKIRFYDGVSPTPVKYTPDLLLHRFGGGFLRAVFQGKTFKYEV